MRREIFDATHTIRIKVCGLKDLETSVNVARLGVDAIGFVFADGKRKVEPEFVRQVVAALPPYVNTVGVFVDEQYEAVNSIASYCKLDSVQLHGSETPEYCRKMNRPVVRTIKVNQPEDLLAVHEYRGVVKGILLDSYSPTELGGSGKSFPWKYLSEQEFGDDFILAGGLNPENIQDAIATCRPGGVDVSSGVETNGIKDLSKVRRFVENVRAIGQSQAHEPFDSARRASSH